jgi:hypothetical protein
MPIQTYHSTFPATENPFSDGGKWVNGGTTGLDWTNARTTTGKIFGTEPGNSGGIYDDSVACLQNMTWGPNQAAEGTVYVTSSPAPNAECELLLHVTISGHSYTGYEFNCSCVTGTTYMTIVRIEGTFGTFTNIAQRLDIGVADGDVMGFTIIGSLLTAYKNGSSVLSGTDTTYPTGAPGVGLFLKNQTGNNANYGFTRFAANDSGTLPSLLVLPGPTVGRAS